MHIQTMSLIITMKSKVCANHQTICQKSLCQSEYMKDWRPIMKEEDECDLNENPTYKVVSDQFGLTEQ